MDVTTEVIELSILQDESFNLQILFRLHFELSDLKDNLEIAYEKAMLNEFETAQIYSYKLVFVVKNMEILDYAIAERCADLFEIGPFELMCAN